MSQESTGNAAGFEAPHIGSKDMPRWDTGELIKAPKFTSRNWFALLGPGLIMGGSAIGGGEWLWAQSYRCVWCWPVVAGHAEHSRAGALQHRDQPLHAVYR